MDRKTFETLLNREVDGLLGPEEEARLNDWTARNPDAAREQRLHHRIHRAFQEMERPEPPRGLGSRIADRVLGRAAPVHRLAARTLLARAAAAVVVLALAGLGGFLAGSEKETVAGPDRQREELVTQWVDWGLTPEQAARVVTIRLRYRDSRIPDAGDLMTGAVLKVLEEAGQLDRYCHQHGLPADEARRLITLADRRSR